jgi:hypothetical protein
MKPSSATNRLVAAAVFFLAAPALTAAGEEEILLDETAAVVASKIPTQKGIYVVTAWNLEAQCRVELIRRYGKAGVERDVSKAVRSAVLKTAVDETVVFMELSRLSLKEIDESLVKEEVGKLAQPFGSEEALWQAFDRFSIKPEHVLSWIRRSIQVDQYIDAQFTMTKSYDASAAAKADIEKFYFRSGLIEEIKGRYRIWVFVKEEPEGQEEEAAEP